MESAKIEKMRKFHKRPGGSLLKIPIKQPFIPERQQETIRENKKLMNRQKNADTYYACLLWSSKWPPQQDDSFTGPLQTQSSQSSNYGQLNTQSSLCVPPPPHTWKVQSVYNNTRHILHPYLCSHPILADRHRYILVIGDANLRINTKYTINTINYHNYPRQDHHHRNQPPALPDINTSSIVSSGLFSY